MAHSRYVMTAFLRLIQSPPRSNIFGAAVIIISAFLFSISSFSTAVTEWTAPISLMLVAAALLAWDIQSLHFSIFSAALITIPSLYPSLHVWPFSLLVPILCYGIAVLMVPRLRISVLWLHRGILDKKTVFTIAAISITATIALAVWYATLKPDLSAQLRTMQAMPIWLFPVAGLVFATGNAAMEEFAFRGIVMQAFDSATGPGIVSILVQAWLFGAMHYLQGFPKAQWGVAMTFAYGVMLGCLRRRSQGMLAPWIAHTCADMVIFGILAWIVLAKTAAP
jgi:membrane protease YdiL (CAAX protease family)